MYENILIPTDGSESASKAVAEAIRLADVFDATLHTIYVVDLGEIGIETYEGAVLNNLEEVGENAVAKVLEQAADAGVEVNSEVVTGGHPYRGILDYVDDHDIDLIVMGTHGRRGLNRYLLGSVTERVVRSATVPVLTIRDGNNAT
ncbi:universal stress protein [Haladaptatus caseinilyticus]|uniref:universal stress protein n=1 Tax=Haladaptatus caseinilyticus TaxID=2993314 RepID=UPI00224B7B90|nr:universal stress protein [Haladaptatus caseinilyticus]